MSSRERDLAFIIYTRAHCPLCDQLVLALELLRPEFDFSYTKIDVDRDPELAARYGLRVPVLIERGTEICAGHFDPATIRGYVCSTSASPSLVD